MENPLHGTIVVSGALAQRPGVGGHTWVFLQYLLGFRELGWEVVFVDQLDPRMCRDSEGSPCDPEDSVNVRYLARVMDEFGLGDAWSVIVDGRAVGLSRADVVSHAAAAPFLLNVMGYLDDEQILAAVPRRVFLDIDPGFGQMWSELGLADIFSGHDDWVTIGENIGRDGCSIPTCGIDWITTPQPVVLDEWRAVSANGGAFTSIASWRGAFGPIEFDGRTYGLRSHEFRKFIGVPQQSGERFEVALDIDEADGADIGRLRAGGWSLVDPVAVAGDPHAYREHIRSSKAEFMVAKNMYVDTASGWVSDRSICYLASGKPVLAQNTGLERHYPLGEGLVGFSTVEEAVSGVEEITGNYDHHARAARDLAEDRFDARKVLGRLLAELGVS